MNRLLISAVLLAAAATATIQVQVKLPNGDVIGVVPDASGALPGIPAGSEVIVVFAPKGAPVKLQVGGVEVRALKGAGFSSGRGGEFIVKAGTVSVPVGGMALSLEPGDAIKLQGRKVLVLSGEVRGPDGKPYTAGREFEAPPVHKQ